MMIKKKKEDRIKWAKIGKKNEYDIYKRVRKKIVRMIRRNT